MEVKFASTREEFVSLGSVMMGKLWTGTKILSSEMLRFFFLQESGKMLDNIINYVDNGNYKRNFQKIFRLRVNI